MPKNMAIMPTSMMPACIMPIMPVHFSHALCTLPTLINSPPSIPHRCLHPICTQPSSKKIADAPNERTNRDMPNSMWDERRRPRFAGPHRRWLLATPGILLLALAFVHITEPSTLPRGHRALQPGYQVLPRGHRTLPRGNRALPRVIGHFNRVIGHFPRPSGTSPVNRALSRGFRAFSRPSGISPGLSGIFPGLCVLPPSIGHFPGTFGHFTRPSGTSPGHWTLTGGFRAFSPGPSDTSPAIGHFPGHRAFAHSPLIPKRPDLLSAQYLMAVPTAKRPIPDGWCPCLSVRRKKKV
jgi:hypothetical protein